MKARFISDQQVTHPDLIAKKADGTEDKIGTTANVRALMDRFNNKEIGLDQYNAQRWVTYPAGSEMEGPTSYWLVLQGVAEPADEECRRMIPADVNLDRVQQAQHDVATAQATNTAAKSRRKKAAKRQRK